LITRSTVGAASSGYPSGRPPAFAGAATIGCAGFQNSDLRRVIISQCRQAIVSSVSLVDLDLRLASAVASFAPSGESISGLTVRQSLAVRFSDPSACGRSLCGKMLRINSSSLSAAAFQPATGHSNQQILIGYSILPELESRYGLSLAHNDAFATIARSMFLACTFVSTSKTFANPFDCVLFRSARFRGRSGAMSTPATRFPRQFPTFLTRPQSPLPFGSSCENPSDQSVRPVQNPEARLTRRSIVSCSPPFPLSIPLRINARNSLPSKLDLSFSDPS